MRLRPRCFSQVLERLVAESGCRLPRDAALRCWLKVCLACAELHECGAGRGARPRCPSASPQCHLAR